VITIDQPDTCDAMATGNRDTKRRQLVSAGGVD
jgi:hypothetical protein